MMRLISTVVHLIAKSIIAVCWIASITTLIPFAALYALHYLFAEIAALTNFIITLPDLRFIVGGILFIGCIGMTTTYIIRLNRPIFAWKLSIEEFFSYLFICGFFSYFYWKSFSIFLMRGYISLMFLFLGFLFFVPNFVDFLSRGGVWIIQFVMRKDRPVKHTPTILARIALLLVVSILSVAIGGWGMQYVQKQQQIRKREQAIQSLTPSVVKWEPKISYHGTRVLFWGNSFGFKEQARVKLVSSYGDVETLEWTDNKIMFAVPLHWKTGSVKLWIVKRIIFEGKQIELKSNMAEITIISRFDPWDSQDDAYFEQIQYFDDETRRLNGHKF